MNSLTFVLVAVGLSGAATLYVLFGTTIFGNWRAIINLPRAEQARRVPFFFSLLTLLSIAAIVFSIHALLVTHSILRGQR